MNAQSIQTEPANGYAHAQVPQAAYPDSAPLGVGQYLLMMLITAIPVVGLIMMLVWAFDGNTNVNRRNYARATLILGAIAIALAIIFSGLLVAMIALIGESYSNT